MSTIAVVGVGAVGTAVAAPLCAAGRERVVLCMRTAVEELAVEGPKGNLRVRVRCVTEPGKAEPAEWVLLATKAHQTAGAADWLRRLGKAGTTVAILQNGVEHAERVAPFVDGAAEMLPVVVAVPAMRTSPGRVRQRGTLRLTVPATDAGRRFSDLFQGTDVEVRTTADFVTAAWRKLCVNVAGGAVTALTGRPLGVMRLDGIADVARELIRECVQVGRAEGAALGDGLVDEIVGSLAAMHEDQGTSMLDDRRAGRPLEWDAKNGAVVRIGKRHGIETPLNAAVAALLAAV